MGPRPTQSNENEGAPGPCFRTWDKRVAPPFSPGFGERVGFNMCTFDRAAIGPRRDACWLAKIFYAANSGRGSGRAGVSSLLPSRGLQPANLVRRAARKKSASGTGRMRCGRARGARLLRSARRGLVSTFPEELQCLPCGRRRACWSRARARPGWWARSGWSSPAY